ncbi:hypothetical protein [Streptomyces sp. NPDC096351]|uniref:hypothetical protein n=1 Tax=Streptomyces sp. NPDC096351 TaxID=3366087 RepID=UPI0038233AC6
MNTSAEPSQSRSDALGAGPPIRQLVREVVADRVPGPRPLQASMLFDAAVDPCEDDGSFLGDFFNEILHQDTCRPSTAGGLALVAALAVDDRIPARYRFKAVTLLFTAATVTERRLAESRPSAPIHSAPADEASARSAVRTHLPDLLARWPAECPAVRLALAGLAVVFPTDRTLPALTPRLRPFADQHPRGSDIGVYVRFVLVLAARDEEQTRSVTEKLTDAYWTATARGLPTGPRALHLLGQMMARVGGALTRSHAER